jgi:NADPH-ferrihemoprotein reductase
MTNVILSTVNPAQVLSGLIRLSRAVSVDDIAALGLLAAGTAGYLLRGTAWDKPDPYQHIWFERPQEKDGACRAAKAATRNIAQKLEEAVTSTSYHHK